MRADRLVSMMLMLQAHGRMTAGDLAEALEVSERTVYRDIDALSMAGVPVYTQPGANGGVALDENYRVSLTGFSSDDIRALFIPAAPGPAADLGLNPYEPHLKLLAALPERHRPAALRMRERFYFDTGSWFGKRPPTPHFPLLQRAVWEDRVVQMRYRRADATEFERTVHPYGLVAKTDVWYLVAAKADTDEIRSYRVERVLHAALGEETFVRPAGFDLAVHWHRAEQQFRDVTPTFNVYLRVHERVFVFFPQVMDGRYLVTEAADDDGWMTMTAQFYSMEEAVTIVMGLGANARVIQPQELLDNLLATARAILEVYP